MKNYLEEYANNSVKKFQMGGTMPAPTEGGGAPAPAPAASPEPTEGQGEGGDIEAMIAQVVETQDPQLALEVVNMIAQEAGLTGGAPAAPEGGAPAAPAQEPAPMPQGKFGMKVPKISSSVLK